jgi:hypothetical protein
LLERARKKGLKTVVAVALPVLGLATILLLLVIGF